MKKLLVFTLIFVLASMASALNEIQISVNGEPAPADSVITLSPSGHLALDIYANVQLNAGFGNTWAMIVNTAYGTVSAASAVINPAYDNVEVDPPYDIGMVFMFGDFPYPPATPTGFGGGVVVFEGFIPAGTTLISAIDFHCVAVGDAIVQLIKLDDGSGLPTGEVYDTVTIHQIPEPATIMLLCLGGLLLRKK